MGGLAHMALGTIKTVNVNQIDEEETKGNCLKMEDAILQLKVLKRLSEFDPVGFLFLEVDGNLIEAFLHFLHAFKGERRIEKGIVNLFPVQPQGQQSPSRCASAVFLASCCSAFRQVFAVRALMSWLS